MLLIEKEKINKEAGVGPPTFQNISTLGMSSL